MAETRRKHGAAERHDSSDADSEGSSSKRRKLHGLTTLEIQHRELEKLMANPDKPVVIPDAPKEKTIKPPRDFIRNVQGSSAGAGSGEFHVYRQVRRREYARIKDMEEKAQKSKEAKEFQEKMARVRAEEEERTAKNRAKRQKKKASMSKRTAGKHKVGVEAKCGARSQSGAEGQSQADERDGDGAAEEEMFGPDGEAQTEVRDGNAKEVANGECGGTTPRRR